MQIRVYWSPKIPEKFPELAICIGTINGVRLKKENERIQKPKKAVYQEVRAQYVRLAMSEFETLLKGL